MKIRIATWPVRSGRFLPGLLQPFNDTLGCASGVLEGVFVPARFEVDGAGVLHLAKHGEQLRPLNLVPVHQRGIVVLTIFESVQMDVT